MTNARRLLERLGSACALGALLAVVLVPRPIECCGNETAAIATLRNIQSAQEEFRDRALVDSDADGRGEFGLFGELSGACFLRGTEAPLDRPLLSSAFCSVDAEGTVRRSGYRFRLFLPGQVGGAVTERPAALPPAAPAPSSAGPDGCPACRPTRAPRAEVGVSAPVDPEAASRRWWCYAWPIEAGNTGNRSFYTDQSGRILVAEDVGYSGDEAPSGAPPGDGWVEMP